MADHTFPLPYKRSSMNRAGLWLFFVSEGFMFAGMLVARFALLIDEAGNLTRPPLDQTLGLVVTSVLLISSYFIYRGETAITHGNQKRFTTSFLIALALGVAFLVGVVGFEWRTATLEGLTPSSGVHGSIFYFMTGMHAFHVLTGVIFLFIIWNNGRKGVYSEGHHGPVEMAALYWHFVDVVWVFFYPALYLVGTAVH